MLVRMSLYMSVNVYMCQCPCSVACNGACVFVCQYVCVFVIVHGVRGRLLADARRRLASRPRFRLRLFRPTFLTEPVSSRNLLYKQHKIGMIR